VTPICFAGDDLQREISAGHVYETYRSVGQCMRQKLVIWGAAAHALITADIIRLRDEYEIVGFLDSINPERAQTEFCGSSILGGEEQLDDLLQHGVGHVIFAFANNSRRLQFASLARAKGFQLATAIHPGTIIAREVPIGAGTVICAAAVVNPGAKLGENVVVATSATVEHECTIEDGAWINTGVCLGGRVVVGRATTLEMGTITAGSVRIGADTVVGAGSLVLNDLPDRVLAYGIPAKIIRHFADEEP
jgi:UDP-N-acetylbacillosamine N-acetyltransferase